MISTVANYILVGVCGAGKHTMMEYFKEEGFYPISISERLRQTWFGQGPETDLLEQVGVKVDVVPDDLVFDVLRPALEAYTRGGFVMESFPYNLVQWSYLRGWLSTLKSDPKKLVFVYLKTDRSTVFQRLRGRMTCTKCFRVYNTTLCPPRVEGLCDYCCDGTLMVRFQDTPEIIERRLEIFEHDTLPILESASKSRYPVLTFDGNRLWSSKQFKEELNRQMQGI